MSVSSPEPISWELAERVATRIAARQPWLPPGRLSVLEEDFAELTAEAEQLVAEETGLVSLAGPARPRVTDRPGWVSANVASFQRLLRPLTQKLEAAMSKPAPMLGPVPMRVPPQVSRNIGGVQLGLLLGWMSTRVLGQYDQLLIEDERPLDQDIVYYVGHNVIELEDRYGFQPRQFRLWIALHEVTHRAQFTGVPWLRPYFLGLVGSLLAGVDPDPKHFIEALKRAAGEAREAPGAGRHWGVDEPAGRPRRCRNEPGRRGPGTASAAFCPCAPATKAAQRGCQDGELTRRLGRQAQAVRAR